MQRNANQNTKWLNSTNVSFLSKRHLTKKESLFDFKETLEYIPQWLQVSDGILCLKSIGDSYGLTLNTKPYDLLIRYVHLKMCVDLKNERRNSTFYSLLVKLAENYGLCGKVLNKVGHDEIIANISLNRFVILSIDSSAFSEKPSSSNHLILILMANPVDKLYLIHDCSEVITNSGKSIFIKFDDLDLVSNHNGVAIWS